MNNNEDFVHSPVISVVLCTYNRAELFANALNSLCKQTIEKSLYEVIIVDNNSQDSTQCIAEKSCLDYPNIKYFLETQQGLSHARNRGWREARGLYIAYIDDDCKVPPQWLTVAIEIIDKIAPAAFGGPYFPFYISPTPNWWKDSYESFDPIQEARSLKKKEYLRGGNLFITRELLVELDGFDGQYGMIEKKIAYGEETDLQMRIRANKPKRTIYYDPGLFLYHLVRPEKMRFLWGLRSYFVSGRYSYHLFSRKEELTNHTTKFMQLLQTTKIILKIFQEFIKSMLQRNRKQYPYIQNYFYENVFQHVHNLGTMYEQYVASS